MYELPTLTIPIDHGCTKTQALATKITTKTKKIKEHKIKHYLNDFSSYINFTNNVVRKFQ